MKSLIFLIFIIPLNGICQTKCDVKSIYSAVEADSDILVLTTSGDVETAEYIMSPMSLSIGTYKLEVSRVAKDYYKVIGKDIIIETRYCYELSRRDEIILDIESSYGYDIGNIIFID